MILDILYFEITLFPPSYLELLYLNRCRPDRKLASERRLHYEGRAVVDVFTEFHTHIELLVIISFKHNVYRTLNQVCITLIKLNLVLCTIKDVKRRSI